MPPSSRRPLGGVTEELQRAIKAVGRLRVPNFSISLPHYRPPARTSYACYRAGRSKSRMTGFSLQPTFGSRDRSAIDDYAQRSITS